MSESNWVQQTHQTKRPDGKQLDEGIGDTLVLAVDVRSESVTSVQPVQSVDPSTDKSEVTRVQPVES